MMLWIGRDTRRPRPAVVPRQPARRPGRRCMPVSIETVRRAASSNPRPRRTIT